MGASEGESGNSGTAGNRRVLELAEAVDSNSRKGFPFAGFQDPCLKPLGHASGARLGAGASRCGRRASDWPDRSPCIVPKAPRYRSSKRAALAPFARVEGR